MPTLHQLLKKPRSGGLKVNGSLRVGGRESSALKNSPQKKGVCLRVYVRNPKKPNSAKRKVTNVLLTTGSKIIGYVSGEGHTLQEHSVVLVRGGRVKDLPGVKYHLVAGAFDFRNLRERRNKRSKYGVKKK